MEDSAMTNAIRPQPGIEEIALYKGGESRIEGRDDVLKLSSNENPFGPPDSAVQAAQAAARTMHRYPSTDHASLRAAIADVHTLDAERIICGVGSDEILTLLCQAYAGIGDEVIYTEHGFSLYKNLIQSVGATPVVVPEKDRVVDTDAILEAVTPKTKLVFVTNPGNPTGTMIGHNALARLADTLPDDVLIVLDGAYVEFVDGFDGGASLVENRSDIIMTRTFSKLYGLGGLRIGWAYGPQDVIDNLNRIRGPFNLSGVQLAAAEAAIRDRAWAEKCAADNARMRTWLAKALAELGVPSDTSCTNFILARFKSEAEANLCEAMLREDGILVRKVAGYGLPNCLRITVGRDADCRRVATSVARFRETAK